MVSGYLFPIKQPFQYCSLMLVPMIVPCRSKSTNVWFFHGKIAGRKFSPAAAPGQRPGSERVSHLGRLRIANPAGMPGGFALRVSVMLRWRKPMVA